MDRARLRKLMPSLVAGHLPRNARNYYYRVYDDQPHFSSFGMPVDPRPFQGTVIDKTDDALIIKTSRVAFAAVDREMATLDPEAGTKVDVVPYARRDFDGSRIDAAVEETHQTHEGHRYTVCTVAVGGRDVRLPLPASRCFQLADLIEQIEQMIAPDGLRKIVHLLVDAGATAFTCVDPEPEAIVDTPPEIAFDVDTAKFRGRVAIVYDRALDLYAVDLRRDDTVLKRVELVDFTTLGTTLADLIDDGHWRRIQISIVGRARKRTLH
ncbi:GTPase [Xanthomonas hortorum]|uniref:GTPase n=1 Tax=Xanthomonas hortorum pv. hederae TaxID=453603 RepID=A0A9X4BSF3_9XANT|nr:GTPase [Xanthomonas hortorum]MCE4369720.1 GTPase [Xanthomonas hortorum pv. hederae]MDC8638734.1 GTPase [Xanthomonas hortorum pv. hederae]PPU86254.1 GTPase [Xanthomonas hortorum pv. hederae]PUF01381.1 GTPase [Xanthomonas hortorum pv. hederae]